MRYLVFKNQEGEYDDVSRGSNASSYERGELLAIKFHDVMSD